MRPMQTTDQIDPLPKWLAPSVRSERELAEAMARMDKKARERRPAPRIVGQLAQKSRILDELAQKQDARVGVALTELDSLKSEEAPAKFTQPHWTQVIKRAREAVNVNDSGGERDLCHALLDQMEAWFEEGFAEPKKEKLAEVKSLTAGGAQIGERIHIGVCACVWTGSGWMSCDEEGWIMWTGGVCPVSGETSVQIRLRSGHESDESRADRWTWNWDLDRAPWQIVFFRVVRWPIA